LFCCISVLFCAILGMYVAVYQVLITNDVDNAKNIKTVYDVIYLVCYNRVLKIVENEWLCLQIQVAYRPIGIVRHSSNSPTMNDDAMVMSNTPPIVWLQYRQHLFFPWVMERTYSYSYNVLAS